VNYNNTSESKLYYDRHSRLGLKKYATNNNNVIQQKSLMHFEGFGANIIHLKQFATFIPCQDIAIKGAREKHFDRGSYIQQVHHPICVMFLHPQLSS
jgi:hypothetical protein